MFTVIFLFVDAGTAQLPIPPSTQERLASTARVEALTQSDFLNLESEAQAGHAAAEHLLALLYEEGRLLPKDLAAAWNWMRKSAEQGYVPAQERMGEMYLMNVRYDGPIPDYGDAERRLRLAAT